MTITKERIAEWRALRNEGITSAVGEYTPSEFWELLDAFEAISSASAWREITEETPAGKYMLYFPEVQMGRNTSNIAMTRYEDFPVHYPRKPTHFLVVPKLPWEEDKASKKKIRRKDMRAAQ